MTSRLSRLAGIALLFVAVSVVMTWPLAPLLSTGVQDDADPALASFLIGWNGWALAHDPSRLFDPPFFHPYPRVLAYAEMLLGETLMVLPLALAGVNALLLHNLTLFAAFVLAGIGAYLLARELGASEPAAIVAGLLFSFSPYHLTHVSHVHVAQVQWIPFVFLYLVRFVRGSRLGDAAKAAACFILQTLCAGNYFVFLYPLVGIFMAIELARCPRGRRLRLLGGFVLFGALSAAVILPVFSVYLGVRNDQGLARSMEESREFSGDLLMYFRMGERPFHVPRASQWVGKEMIAFPGIAAYGLALVALLAPLAFNRSKPGTAAGETAADESRPAVAPTWRGSGSRLATSLSLGIAAAGAALCWWMIFLRKPVHGGWLHVAAVAAASALFLLLGRPRAAAWLGRAWGSRKPGTALALGLMAGGVLMWTGPDVHLAGEVVAPGLHRLLFGRLPAWDGVRVPSRAWVFFGLGLSILAAHGADRVLAARVVATRVRLRTAAAIGLCVLALLELHPGPMPLRRNDFPDRGGPAYRWLREHPVGALLELPMGVTGDDAWKNARYLPAILDHGHPVLNGYSGYFTPLHGAIISALRGRDLEGLRRLLAVAGTRYIVLHRRHLETPFDQKLPAFADKVSRGRIAFRDDAVTIYDVAAAPPESAPPLALSVALPQVTTEGKASRAGLLIRNGGKAPLFVERIEHTVEVAVGTWSTTRRVRRMPLFNAPGDSELIPFDIAPRLRRGQHAARWRVLDGARREVASGGDRLKHDSPDVDSTSLESVAFLRARFERIELPAIVRPAEIVVGSVVVQNAGSVIWRADRPTGTQFVRLAWEVRSASDVALNWARAPLPCDVAPRQVVEIPFRLTGPHEPGVYSFTFDLVDEHVAWFKQLTPDWVPPAFPLLVTETPPSAQPRFGPGFFAPELGEGGEIAAWMSTTGVLEPPVGTHPSRLELEAKAYGEPQELVAAPVDTASGGVARTVRVTPDADVSVSLDATGPIRLTASTCQKPPGDERCLAVRVRAAWR